MTCWSAGPTLHSTAVAGYGAAKEEAFFFGRSRGGQTAVLQTRRSHVRSSLETCFSVSLAGREIGPLEKEIRKPHHDMNRRRLHCQRLDGPDVAAQGAIATEPSVA